MPHLCIDGQQIHYFHHSEQGDADVGCRPPVVFVHGAGGNYLHWPPYLRRLPQTDIYAVDLAGHGKSQGRGQSSIGAYREGIGRFIQELGLASFVLVGHSMGAAIALDLARTCPDTLVGLVLIGAGAQLPVPSSILHGLNADRTSATKCLAHLALSPDAPAKLKQIFLDRLRAVDPAVLLGDLLACDAFDGRTHLAFIQVPTFIVCGRLDAMVPVQYGEYLQQNLAHSELHVIERAGHMVMWEQPETTAGLFERFLGIWD